MKVSNVSDAQKAFIIKQGEAGQETTCGAGGRYPGDECGPLVLKVGASLR